MKLREMFELKVGDRVLNNPYPDHRDFGEVVHVTDTGIEVRWESSHSVPGRSFSNYDARDYMMQPKMTNISSLSLVGSVNLKKQPALLMCGITMFVSGILYGMFKQQIPAELSGPDTASREFLDGYQSAAKMKENAQEYISKSVELGQIIVERKV